MGWDSNPRWACTHAGFQDRCLKPLGHPSDQREASRFEVNTPACGDAKGSFAPLPPVVLVVEPGVGNWW